MSSLSDSIDARPSACPGGAAGTGLATFVTAAEGPEAVSARAECLIRLVLALSALAVVVLDPLEPTRLAALTYGTLVLYTTYSAVLFWAAARTEATPWDATHTWIDVGSYVVLAAFSGGTGSLFFFFFFFGILVASFRGGFVSGLWVTVVSATLFSLVAYAASLQGELELNRFLLRPICLLVLGYMIAAWGGSELSLKRRLAFLKSISRSANPRFGVDQTVGSLMESVRGFYDADACLLVTQSQETLEYSLRRADRYKPDRAVKAERLSGEIGLPLTSLPGEEAVAVVRKQWLVGRARRSLLAGGARPDHAKLGPALDRITRLVGDESYLSVPWRQANGMPARLYVTSRAGKFDRGQLDFLCQVVAHAAPLVENMHLLDRLASAAAEQERRRISLDLHDSTVQPYMGLKMGIESIRRKATPDNPLAGDLNELAMRVEIGLSDLRGYVRGLKGKEQGSNEPALSAAAREYGEQFARLYGVKVACDVESGVAVSDRLAAEAFQIMREGLSNVYRHTPARSAAVRLLSRAGRLVIEVENETASAPPPFTPRSIKERAEALGGMAQVVVNGGSTVVRAEIPV